MTDPSLKCAGDGDHLANTTESSDDENETTAPPHNANKDDDDEEVDPALASGLLAEPDGAFAEFRRRVINEHAVRAPEEVVDVEFFSFICAKK